MASVLPSCIGSTTFCSHRQAAFFLLVTLIPFFSPFLILCLPFLILFLAPMSVLICSLLLLHKMQVTLRWSGRGQGSVIPRTELEGKTFAEEVEEGRKCEGLFEDGGSEGSSVQSMVASEPEDAKDLHTSSPASVRDLLVVELDDAKELKVRHEMDEKQEEPNWMEETMEKTEDISSREKGEEEGLEVPPSSSAESSIDHLKEEQEAMVEGISPDQEEKPMRAEEEQATREGKDNSEDSAKDKPKTTPSDSLEEEILTKFPSTHHEQGHPQSPSLEVTSIARHPSDTPEEEQGHDPSRDLPKAESGVHESKEEFCEVPGILSDTDVGAHESMHEFSEVPGKDASSDKGFEIETSLDTGEHFGQEPLLRSGKQSGSGHVSVLEKQDSKDELHEVRGNLSGAEADVHELMDEFAEVPGQDASSDKVCEIETHLDTGDDFGQDPALPSKKKSGSGHVSQLEKQDLHTLMEKEIEEGEPSGSSLTDDIERESAETLAEHVQDDEQPQVLKDSEQPQLLKDAEQPQEGMPVSNVDASFQLDSAEQDRPFETGCSAASPPQRPNESFVGSQEERRILADIDAIKRIVGYEGDSHGSVMEEITALYLFLGMEPYWDVEVVDLERARTEVEVLKVVVGVK